MVRTKSQGISHLIRMRNQSLFLIAAVIGFALVGCSSELPSKQARKQARSPSPLKSETTAVKRAVAKKPEPSQPVVPAVHLSEQHQSASLVIQGDLLPNFRLADAEGASHSLHSLLGDQVTVVCFWSGESPAALQQLRDTGPEIVGPFGEQGVEVVSINYGQSAAEVRKVTEQTDFSEKV